MKGFHQFEFDEKNWKMNSLFLKGYFKKEKVFH